MQEKAEAIRNIFEQLTSPIVESDISELSVRKEAEFNNQEEYIKRWTNYIKSVDYYPDWFKEVALNTLRSDEDIPDLNAEALSCTYDILHKNLSKKDNFLDIYRFKLQAVETIAQEPKEQTNAGRWEKFEHGSSLFSLYKSIKNHGTGWAIAGENVSVNQHWDNDFYVYFSKDKNENYSIPRIFIKVKDEQVMEVGGITKYQNLEPFLLSQVDNQINNLSLKINDEISEKKDNNHKITDFISNVRRSNLSNYKMSFLYEIDEKIKCFGFDTDPRVQEFISKRDIKQDLAFIFYCKPEEISICKDEAIKGDMGVHYGDLNIDDITSLENINLPKVILGNLYLKYVKSIDGMKLPLIIKGIVDLSSLPENQKMIIQNSYPNLKII